MAVKWCKGCKRRMDYSWPEDFCSPMCRQSFEESEYVKATTPPDPSLIGDYERTPDPATSLRNAESPEIRALRAELERVTQERYALQVRVKELSGYLKTPADNYWMKCADFHANRVEKLENALEALVSSAKNTTGGQVVVDTQALTRAKDALK